MIESVYYVTGADVAYICNIECKEDCATVILTDQFAEQYRLWINEHYIGASTGPEMIKFPLQKGNNTLCFVYHKSSTAPQLLVRINSFENEDAKEYASLTNENLTNKAYRVRSTDIEYNWNIRNQYTAFVSSFDWINIDINQDIDIVVSDYYSSEKYFVGKTKFNQLFTVPLYNLPYFDDDRINCFDIRISYRYADGTEKYFLKQHCFEPVSSCKEKLKKEAQKIFDTPAILESAKLNIRYRLDLLLQAKENHVSAAHRMSLLKRDINLVLKNEGSIYEYVPGLTIIYYTSAIDNRIRSYNVILPENYDKTKAYPLIALITYNDNTNITTAWDYHDVKYDVIIADIPTRELTMGSYIGEACIEEVLSDLRTRFSIDNTHVNILGYSSAASAVWLQGELNPGKYGMLAACAGGFNPTLLKNLENTHILHMESAVDSDQWANTSKSFPLLQKLPSYHFICGYQLSHSMIRYSYLTQSLLKALSKEKGDPYPNNDGSDSADRCRIYP